MKKILLVLVAVVLISTFAYAEGAPKPGEFGIQGALIFTGVVPTGAVGAKYWVSQPVIALRAALGFLNVAATGLDVHGIRPGAGFEYHFGGKGSVSPYAGARGRLQRRISVDRSSNQQRFCGRGRVWRRVLLFPRLLLGRRTRAGFLTPSERCSWQHVYDRSGRLDSEHS